MVQFLYLTFQPYTQHDIIELFNRIHNMTLFNFSTVYTTWHYLTFQPYTQHDII